MPKGSRQVPPACAIASRKSAEVNSSHFTECFACAADGRAPRSISAIHPRATFFITCPPWRAESCRAWPLPGSRARPICLDLRPEFLKCPDLSRAALCSAARIAQVCRGPIRTRIELQQTASVPLRKGAKQCRAKHCIERPVPDRGQALGVRYFWHHASRNGLASRPWLFPVTIRFLALAIRVLRRRVPVSSSSAARISFRFWLLLHNLGRPFRLRGWWRLSTKVRRRPFPTGRSRHGASGPVQ